METLHTQRFFVFGPWRMSTAPFRPVLLLLLLVLLGIVPTLPVRADSSETQMGQFLGAKETSHPDWFKDSFLDFEEDIAEAAAQNKRLIVYFHQDGCPYCNKLVEHNFADPVIAEKIKGRFDLVALNLWGDREVVPIGGKVFSEKTLGQALAVQFTPTLLFFNEENKVILRLDGYLPPRKFIMALDYVSEKREREISYANYVNQVEKAKRTGALNRADWLLSPPYDLSALVGNKPIAILFEEPDCKNCDLLHSNTFQDPSAAKLIEQFHMVQLNRWSDMPVTKPDGNVTSAVQWANELGLSYTPAIILFDTGGNQVIALTGMFRTFHILGALDYVASDGFKQQPSFQRYLSERAEHIRATGADVDIWKY